MVQRELVDAVSIVSAADVYVQPTVAGALTRGLARRDGTAREPSRFEMLTERTRSPQMNDCRRTHGPEYRKAT